MAVWSLILASLPAAKIKPFKLSGWVVSSSSNTANHIVLRLSGAQNVMKIRDFK
jgi:hypothetical protein